MNGGIWVVVGVVVGWILNEWTRWRYYKRERAERRLSIYQQAFFRVNQLRVTLARVMNYVQQIQPQIDDLKQWWNQHSLSMDPETNNALVGLINTITLTTTPRQLQGQRIRAINLLSIAGVNEALNQAEAAIRSVTDQAIEIARRNRLRDDLSRDYVVTNILTFFVFGALSIWSFYISGDKSIPSFSLDSAIGMMFCGGVKWVITWLLLLIGILSGLWAIALSVITFRYRLAERFAERRLLLFKRRNDIAFFTALVVVFAASFIDVLGKTLAGGLPHYYVYIVYFLGILALLVSVAIYLRRDRAG